MTTKHASPEWSRTTRTIRAQAKRTYQAGDTPTCWRCGRPIEEGQAFDVGHLDAHAGEGVDNAAPEHRNKSAYCLGNRAAGGRVGAAITNARKSKSTFQPLPWA